MIYVIKDSNTFYEFPLLQDVESGSLLTDNKQPCNEYLLINGNFKKSRVLPSTECSDFIGYTLYDDDFLTSTLYDRDFLVLPALIIVLCVFSVFYNLYSRYRG